MTDTLAKEACSMKPGEKGIQHGLCARKYGCDIAGKKGTFWAPGILMKELLRAHIIGHINKTMFLKQDLHLTCGTLMDCY